MTYLFDFIIVQAQMIRFPQKNDARPHSANIETRKITKSSVEAQEIFNLLKNKLPQTVLNKEIEEIVRDMFETYKFTRK